MEVFVAFYCSKLRGVFRVLLERPIRRGCDYKVDGPRVYPVYVPGVPLMYDVLHDGRRNGADVHHAHTIGMLALEQESLSSQKTPLPIS